MENPIYEYLMDIVNNEKVSDFHLHADKPLAFRGDGEIKTRDNMLITLKTCVIFSFRSWAGKNLKNSTHMVMSILLFSMKLSVFVPAATR